MGRKKSVPGPLKLMQQPSAVPAPAPVPTGAGRTGAGMDTTNSWNGGHGSGQGHSQGKGTLAGGETQRLSPSTASLSVTGSSVSMSPKSPRFPYTSRFSPKNLTSGHNPKSSPQSQTQPQLQLQPQPQPRPPRSVPPQTPPLQATQRKAVPQPHHQYTPKDTTAHHPIPYPQYQSQSQSQPQPNPTSHSHSQQRQAHTQLQQPNSRSHDSHSPKSTTSSDSKQPHIAELQQRLHPITRAVTASSHQQSKQHQHVERRLKSSHGRRHGDDTAASNSDYAQLPNHNHKQGFFFNFSKSAKSFDRPLHLAQAQAQAQPQPTLVAMSATDQPSITKQSSKQSGKKMAPKQ